MPYEIKNGKIVAKDTKGQNRSFPKDAIDAIIGEGMASILPDVPEA